MIVNFKHAESDVKLEFNKNSITVSVDDKPSVELPKASSVGFLEFTIDNIITGKNNG